MQSDAWWHTENQDVQYQSLTPHKDYASIFNFMISVLLIFVPQFKDFVNKSKQLRAAYS